MNIAPELKSTSLAERIAKVRNRMLVATLTHVPPTNKELFIALCRTYERRNAEKSSFSGELFAELPLPQALFHMHETQENTSQQWPECMLVKKFSQGLVENFKDSLDEEDDGFCDWPNDIRSH